MGITGIADGQTADRREKGGPALNPEEQRKRLQKKAQ